MKETNSEIDTLLKDYVLICKDFNTPRISINEGRWSETLPGFQIITPQYGLIDKKTWEYLKVFQSLKVEEHFIIQVVSNGSMKNKIPTSDEDCLNDPMCSIWLKLIEKSHNFQNTVFEFNLLERVLSNGEAIYKRCAALLGMYWWKEITL